jgi:hypothetical protein
MVIFITLIHQSAWLILNKRQIADLIKRFYRVNLVTIRKLDRLIIATFLLTLEWSSLPKGVSVTILSKTIKDVTPTIRPLRTDCHDTHECLNLL